MRKLYKSTFGAILLSIPMILFAQTDRMVIKVDWVKEVKGDFSFKDKWEYPEWIFENEARQLVCDGLCPDGLESMYNSQGLIIPDSMHLYYQLVDTTHQYYSVAMDDWDYNSLWYAHVERINDDSVTCSTMLGVSTYWSLSLAIKGDYAYPQIDFHSPGPEGHSVIPCIKGKITVDKNLWKRNVMKASFDLTFSNRTRLGEKIRWRGRIYALMERKRV